MSLLITGATGHLGRLVVEQLLAADVPAGDIVATGRSTDKIKDLADRGVQVRAVDFGDPGAVRAALAGADRVLLVSAMEPAARVGQHGNVIDAARQAGVSLVAYTSIVNAGTASIRLAEDHQATERLLRDSGVPHVLLRNGWYHENYTDRLPAFLAQGAIPGSAGQGLISAAGRADYAAAAVRVLTTDGHDGQAYELGGDEPFTLAELAAEISAQSGREVRYVDLPEAEYAEALKAHGVPALMADMVAETDAAAARGALHTASGHLAALTGRPAVTLSAAVSAALSALDRGVD
ncbi:MAG TPA: SDR family oxidoreductase [Trebonia sp.]|jgi:NAD(P)H dehydrogenase (quinone)|nr:SDR family oxidoreductase [Trebonia sp.]